ncbi:MAG: glutamate synthase [Gammaproteobacteria bacterium]|nr:MAG: glutamate synthase [Gammaproteobacteria bacterium]
MNDTVNIVGVLVHCAPENTESVAQRLKSIVGVEVHAQDDKGHIVVTVDESESDGTAVEQLEKIHRMDGVLCAALTYHHVEDRQRLDEPMPVDEPNSPSIAL